MPLEFAFNTLDNATHTELDSQILNSKLTRRLQKFEILQPSDCMALLVVIASRSNGCIDPKYTDIEEAMELIHQNEDLQVALAEAFKAKSFRTIRNLSTNSTLPTIVLLITMHRDSPAATIRGRAHSSAIC